MVQGGSDLYERIWKVARRIPRGKVATYGMLAALAGRPGQPRLAGYAMRNVPDGSGIPWHRVINARGEISPRAGGSIESGMQRALLESEGIRFDETGRIDLNAYLWKARIRR